MIQIPKGCKDVLPSQSHLWQYVEKTARETAHEFGFREIRTPVFEHTELFLRGVGDTTDIEIGRATCRERVLAGV